MIIKKNNGHEITVYFANSETHAIKFVYSLETNDEGKYTLKETSDLNCFMADKPENGDTIIEANLKNKIRNDGFEEISMEDFYKDYETV